MVLDGRVVARLQQNDYFGELALLCPGKQRTCTVRTVTDATLFRLTRDAFKLIMDASPGLKEQMLHSRSYVYREHASAEGGENVGKAMQEAGTKPKHKRRRAASIIDEGRIGPLQDADL